MLSAALPLALAGCVFGAPDTQPGTPAGPVATFMAGASVNESRTLDDPDFGTDVRVRVDENFTSARGEDCKRGTVLTGSGETEVIVICRDAAGHWNMAPRVWGQGIAR